MLIKFKRIHENAKLPKQGKPGDAAFDLTCVEDFTLHAGETKAVSTGLVLADMSSEDDRWDAVFLHIVGRSGLALKGVFPLGGIVDSTYRGEIKVILHNGNPSHKHSSIAQIGAYDFTPTIDFKAGDRIASMLIQKVVANDERERVVFEETSDVSTTTRRADGFGSTDKQP